MSNNKEGIREKCEYTFSKLMMYMESYMYNNYEEEIKNLAAIPSYLCAAVWLELRFLCPVAVRVRPRSLLSSGRFLCPVAVLVRLKSLSSAELTPSAIPIKRATPQSN